VKGTGDGSCSNDKELATKQEELQIFLQPNQSSKLLKQNRHPQQLYKIFITLL
jgi:hypothetical protein